MRADGSAQSASGTAEQKRGGIAPLLSSAIVQDGAEAAASAECRILPRCLARCRPVCYNGAITDGKEGQAVGDGYFLLTNLLSEDEKRVITSITAHIERGENAHVR